MTGAHQKAILDEPVRQRAAIVGAYIRNHLEAAIQLADDCDRAACALGRGNLTAGQ